MRRVTAVSHRHRTKLTRARLRHETAVKLGIKIFRERGEREREREREREGDNALRALYTLFIHGVYVRLAARGYCSIIKQYAGALLPSVQFLF